MDVDADADEAALIVVAALDEAATLDAAVDEASVAPESIDVAPAPPPVAGVPPVPPISPPADASLVVVLPVVARETPPAPPFALDPLSAFEAVPTPPAPPTDADEDVEPSVVDDVAWGPLANCVSLLVQAARTTQP